jgi:hypothetical protein
MPGLQSYDLALHIVSLLWSCGLERRPAIYMRRAPCRDQLLAEAACRVYGVGIKTSHKTATALGDLYQAIRARNPSVLLTAVTADDLHHRPSVRFHFVYIAPESRARTGPEQSLPAEVAPLAGVRTRGSCHRTAPPRSTSTRGQVVKELSSAPVVPIHDRPAVVGTRLIMVCRAVSLGDAQRELD